MYSLQWAGYALKKNSGIIIKFDPDRRINVLVRFTVFQSVGEAQIGTILTIFRKIYWDFLGAKKLVTASVQVARE